MDFMVNLPPSREFDAIMVVVDRFNKMAHFIPTKETAMAQETRRLFFTHVFKHHGLPKDIVSDRNPEFINKFINKFWRALWKHMGSKFKMNTSFQPQTDGQTEKVNLVIQQFLRNYVATDVATLALGSRPRQGVARLWAKRKTRVTSHAPDNAKE
jgi:hypothetical protein